MANPQVGVVEEANAVANELNQACLLQKPQLGERRRRLNGFCNHELFRVVESLLQQRDEDGRTMPANERRDTHDAVEEGAAQVFVLFVVEESYDVRQNYVVRCRLMDVNVEN